MGDHEVCPVHPTGLVEERNGLDGDIAEPFADEPPDERHVGGKRRAYVIRLEEFDLRPLRTAGTCPANKRDIAPVAP